MRLCNFIAFAAAIALSPAAGFAQVAPAKTSAPAPKKGFVLKDRNGRKIGTIDTVRSDGVITFIRDMRIFQIPLTTVTTSGRTSTTSKSWEEIHN